MTLSRTVSMLGAVAMLVFAASAAQGQATYKCVSRGEVTYTHVPCAGGQRIGAGAPKRTQRSRPVPQDRATIARRAVLTPDERQECRALDVRLLEQQQELKARGDAATLDDEMPLVRSKKRFRELRC